MALNCEDKLSADIQKNCDYKPIGGIEVNVVLINADDIDKTASTLDSTNDLLITLLELKSGKTGYKIEGIKQAQGGMFELVKKENSFDAYKHTFQGVILTPSVDNKKALDEIADGGRYVAIIEKKWKGEDQKDAFEVLGWDSGMVIAESTWNTKENDGVILFSIASEDGYEEPKLTRNILENDYDTTKTAFENAFASS